MKNYKDCITAIVPTIIELADEINKPNKSYCEIGHAKKGQHTLAAYFELICFIYEVERVTLVSDITKRLISEGHDYALLKATSEVR